MYDNIIKEYEDRSIKLQQRYKTLIELEYAIEEYLPEHNQRINKLYKGYKSLGYYDNYVDMEFCPITWEKYAAEFQNIDDALQTVIKIKPKNRENEIELNTLCEKIIAFYLLLSADRWNTLFAYKKVWRKKRIKFEDACEEIMQKYRALGKIEACDDKQKWINRVGDLFIKQMKLIDDQEKVTSLEEQAMNEFAHLVEVREGLLVSGKLIFME